MGRSFEYLDLFIDAVYAEFDIKEILEEDVSEYVDCEPTPQIYFVDKQGVMVAHWNLYTATGHIRTYIQGGHWSKSKRKFKKLKRKDLNKLYEY